MIHGMKVTGWSAVLLLGALVGGAAAAQVVAKTGGAARADSTDWTARWIQAPWSTEMDGAELDGSRPMPIFRREFHLKAAPVKATLRIAGLGQYEAWLNGQPVSPEGLHQAWTDYKKTVTFDVYDLTKQVREGENVLGVMLGNGMYNVQRTKGRYTKFAGSFGPPKLIAELRLTYANGKTEVLDTDGRWMATPGPVTFDSTYGGEDFDERKLDAGWDSAGFRQDNWKAAETTDGPGGVLIPAIAPDVRVVQTFAGVKETELAPGKVVYDFGQNFAGWPKIAVQGPAGAVLKLTPGELLKPDGSVSQASSGGPMWWSYTLRGDKAGEEWAPRFSYYGFRYVQAEWVSRNPGASGASGKILGITGEELSSASVVVGRFESSDQMLNAIHRIIVYAMHSNEVSIFTDCPHREKLGWLEETHLVASGLMFNSDLRGLYAATARNIADTQHEDGDVPTIAPQYTRFGTNPKYAMFDDSPEWGSASVLAQWDAYRFYGDKKPLEKNYAVMQRYVKYLRGRADSDGIVAFGLGDWYDIGPNPPGVSQDTSLGVTGTLMLYEDAAAMQRIATLLGRASDAAMYATLAKHEAEAFNHRFWNADKGYYDTGSQTASAMPLALGIVPEDRRASVMQHIVADIHAHDDHITTGEVGYPYLLRALMDGGQNDLLLTMMRKKTPPSYGSQIEAGATSLTEAWDANPRASQDHFMLGSGEEWFYRGLGGIDVDMSRSADERITIRPRVVHGLDWVKCSYDSVLGPVRSDWKQGDGTTSMDIAVPPGATATLILPARMVPSSPENGLPKGTGTQLTKVGHDDEVVVYRATAGLFHFREAESQ